MSWFGFIRAFLIVVLAVGLSQCKETVPMEELFVLDSKILSKKISITTYIASSDDENIPMVYITDGQKMIENSALDRIKKLTAQGKIPKAYYVFISTIDAATNEDKRNTYFFCNDDYVRFFEEELIATIEGHRTPKQRSLIGVSFGGLNTAYFSGKTVLFQNYALLSPITYPRKEALSSIAFSENKDLQIFISTGTNDAENYVEALYQLYTSKGFQVKKMKTEGTHDFDNWNSQWEEVMNFLNATTI